ncbi:hypothetical protein ACI65C_009292 [Semiaphis heraclei]
MSTRNNNNNNNNNKDISKMNNAVSPLTISKNKTSNSSLGTSNNPLDVGWTIQKSKRNLSSSTNSEPNSPAGRPMPTHISHDSPDFLPKRESHPNRRASHVD